MKEVHWSDGRDPSGNPDTRTIKCAKIFFQYGGLEYCLYDCPGHLEYGDQISQGLEASHYVVGVIDETRREESIKYIENLRECDCLVHSHSTKNGYNHYNDFGDRFKGICERIIKEIVFMVEQGNIVPVDVEEEAKELIRTNITDGKNNAMFFSGGKDSLVGLSLLKSCGKSVRVLFPYSGYDFPETEQIVEDYEKFFGVKIKKFDNTCGKKYETHSAFEMMQSKAQANDDIIAKENIDLVCVQYRASDEGVRSKDYHLTFKEDATRPHYRFSPVFYFSETNIWRYIKKHNLPVCELYYKGYRSLGDAPVTKPCMPELENIDNIIDWIETNQNTNERDGRTGQDKSVSFAMEKLRNVGFF